MSQGRGQRAGEQYKINGMDVNQDDSTNPRQTSKSLQGSRGS